MTTALALPESRRLSELEDVIRSGMRTFVQVGEALMEIREDRLYREDFPTFEDYCQERWGFTARRALQMVSAAAIGTIVPVQNEGQARELAPLKDEPEQLREAWVEASSDGEPTALKVKEAVTRRRMDVHYSSERDDWSTPQELFDALDAEFHFDLDVCATEASAKCAKFYSEQDDGLAQLWSGMCWMNPPYGSEIRRWVEKAWQAAENGATVVCLVPARVETGWWWDFCRHGEVRFLRGRLAFGGGENSAPFPSAVVVFGPQPRTVYWEWAA
jgi:phage N-6-adenine-methyltransferase